MYPIQALCPRPRTFFLIFGFVAINYLLLCYTGLLKIGPNLLDHVNNLSIGAVETTPSPVSRNDPPIILFWNSHFSAAYKHFVPNKNTHISCPYKCQYSTDKKKHGSKADIRLFHERTIDQTDLPPENPNALNIYYTLEAPPLSFSIHLTGEIPADYFNATASYRSNSEIYYPYDYFMPLNGSENKDDIWTDKQIEEKLKKKKKIAMNAMTNCNGHSKRHTYISEMQKFINVTRVGGCQGNTLCKKVDTAILQWKDSDCMAKMIDEHYFYLAFENAVCPEYVSEKFWRLRELIVPVVLSRAAMPPNIPHDTYIAASDFETIEALTNHLQYLIRFKDKYKKYFAWTKKYRKNRVKEEEIAVSCQLCKMAHDKKRYYIPNYEQAWSNDVCIKDYALNLVNDRKSIQNSENGMYELVKETYQQKTIGKVV